MPYQGSKSISKIEAKNEKGRIEEKQGKQDPGIIPSVIGNLES